MRSTRVCKPSPPRSCWAITSFTRGTRSRSWPNSAYLPVIAHRDILNGIDFIVEDRETLLVAIRDAKSGERAAFVEGSSSGWKKHWPLTLSFLATDGVGFREIFRPRYNDRPLDTMATMRFDTRLGRDVSIDISAMHLAVAQFSTLSQVRAVMCISTR